MRALLLLLLDLLGMGMLIAASVLVAVPLGLAVAGLLALVTAYVLEARPVASP